MPESRNLHILWTNDNLTTSLFMVMQYSINSMTYKLWDSVTVILWGAPVALTAGNEVIQEEIKVAQHVGVKFSACISCARRLDAVEKLESLGIEVIPWVEPFTQMVKDGEPIIYV